MSSPPQANDFVNGVGVSGGGGCNKLIGEHSPSPFGVRQKAIRGRWQRTISKYLVRPNFPNPAGTDIFCRPRFPPARWTPR